MNQEEIRSTLKDVEGLYAGKWHLSQLAKLAKPYFVGAKTDPQVLAFAFELGVLFMKKEANVKIVRPRVEDLTKPMFRKLIADLKRCCNEV